MVEQWEQHSQSEPDPAERLADLKKRREALLAYNGTDAWVSADVDLLEQLDAEIATLEGSRTKKAS